MNIYLLQLVSKWASILLVSLTSFLPTNSYKNMVYTVNNKTDNMNVNIVTNIVDFNTKYEYSKKIPSNISKTLTEGVDGITYYNPDDNTKNVLRPMIAKVVLVGTGAIGEYTGSLTGYGPDCPGCSKVGNVSCRTREKVNHSLIHDGIYYTDTEYGEVRILAAATVKFPCGTIIKVDNGILKPFYGVVLDTGFTMRKAWESGKVWIDLAFPSQASVKQATNHSAKFSVQRWGW